MLIFDINFAHTLFYISNASIDCVAVILLDLIRLPVSLMSVGDIAKGSYTCTTDVISEARGFSHEVCCSAYNGIKVTAESIF